MQQTVEFVPYDAAFLPLSWAWLNDPEIKALTMTPDFDREGQARWFEGLAGRTDYLIWGVLSGGRRVGACGLKGIAQGRGEYWGYIGDKSCWGQGIGGRMVGFIEDQARARGLGTLWLQVWERNMRACRLYERLGFLPDGHEGDVAIFTKPLH